MKGEDHVHCHYIVPSSAPLSLAGLDLLRPCDLLQISTALAVGCSWKHRRGVLVDRYDVVVADYYGDLDVTVGCQPIGDVRECVLCAGVTTAEMASSACVPWFPILKRLAHVGRQEHNQLSKVAAPEGVHSAVYDCIGRISLMKFIPGRT